MKGKSKGLVKAAADRRQETKRELLAAFAPTMILNEWDEDEDARRNPAPVMDLPDLHPVVAQGVVEWMNEPGGLPHAEWVRVARYAASIAARASTL